MTTGAQMAAKKKSGDDPPDDNEKGTEFTTTVRIRPEFKRILRMISVHEKQAIGAIIEREMGHWARAKWEDIRDKG